MEQVQWDVQERQLEVTRYANFSIVHGTDDTAARNAASKSVTENTPSVSKPVETPYLTHSTWLHRGASHVQAPNS